jgi:hypothetical protein
MKKMFFLAVVFGLLHFHSILYSQQIKQGPPERIEVMGYPLTATQNQNGVVLSNCGPDMTKICYIRYKYPSITNSTPIGSDIDIYYGDLNNGIGYINSVLLTEIEDDSNPLPFTIFFSDETLFYDNYNDWIEAIESKYNINN